MSKAPPLRRSTSAQSPSTSRTSGRHSGSVISPRRSLQISLSRRKVLKVSSTSRNQANAASTAAGSMPGSRTSTVITVPIAGSARTVREIVGTEAASYSGTGHVQCRLHRLRVALAVVRRPAQDVDLSALGLQDLLPQVGHDHRGDVGGLRIVIR